MTGIKQGAGEDPFNERSEWEEPSSEEEAETENTATTDTDSTGNDSTEPKRATQRRPIQILYKFRRDGVQDNRSRVSLSLQKETKSAERDALRELEERVDENVSLTDLREALVLVGLDHLDEVEGHLEEWGYGMTFDE